VLKLFDSTILTPPEIMTDPNSSSQTTFGFPGDCENLEEFSLPFIHSQKLVWHDFDRHSVTQILISLRDEPHNQIH
jgi:hypothetical protein